MRVVLQPLNERAADLIVSHVDLLEAPAIDPLLLQVRCRLGARTCSVHCAALWASPRTICPACSLLAEPVPPVHASVTQLVAHVFTNKVILKRWEEGGVREWSAISYPTQVGGGQVKAARSPGWSLPSGSTIYSTECC